MLVRHTALVGRLTRAALLLLLLCTLGCMQEEKNAQAKFVALTQQHGTTKKSLLINKVHKSAWKIRYGFSDNKNCSGLFGARARTQLTTSITKSLSVWLQALVLIGNIVQSFSYELKDTKETNTSGRSYDNDRKFSYGLFGYGKPDLAIIFYCRTGRASAQVYENPPELYMFQNGSPRNRMTPQGLYSITTLLHEIGHAFGLGDTYVDNTRIGQEQSRYNQSEGGATLTVGTQPLSVMNSHFLIALSDSGDLQLGADDHAGINWLYDFHRGRSISKTDCPTDYIYEESTKGCTPRYPLIFMVKQAGLLAMLEFLDDDTSTINQQDQRGNTALHYAANLAAQHGRDMYDLLIQYGAQDTLKNKNGETAQELLEDNTNRFITTMFAAVRRLPRQQGILAVRNDAFIHMLVKQFLSDTRNDVNMQDKSGTTLLHYAARHGRLQLLQTLLQRHDLDVNAQARLSEETALHKAARHGQPEVAEALLAHVNIDIEDVWGRTALSRAIYAGWQASVKDETKLAARIRKVAALIRDHERGDEPNTEPDTDNVDSYTCNGNNCSNRSEP